MADHAVVIGGSIAGLISARVLSDYFDKVTVLERDQIDDRPVIHKSVPQGNQFHALLQGGQRVLASLSGIYRGVPKSRCCAGHHGPRYRLVPSRRQSLTKFRPSKSVRADRGAMVCRAARGNARSHICAYHQG
jgi:2-polyprenyl-6-methoxyphenol hydroxylase-like FAD-dependent oxidoreductase